MNKKLSIVIGVLVIAVVAYLGYMYYSGPTASDIKETTSWKDFYKSEHDYVASVIDKSKTKTAQAILTAQQGTKLVTPSSPNGPLVLKNATDDDFINIYIYFNGSIETLDANGCVYHGPWYKGPFPASQFGDVIELFPNARGSVLIDESIGSRIKKLPSSPLLKKDGDKFELGGKLVCGEGDKKVTLAEWKAIIEFQK